MKSSPKAESPSPAAWNPPDLNDVSSNGDQNVSREKALAIFQNELDATQESEQKNIPLNEKDRQVVPWQPGYLGEKMNRLPQEAWAFLEVSDTPFDKSWKVQRPGSFSDGSTPREKEAARYIDAARSQAEEIILAAQAEADQILLQAETEIEEQKKAGYQQGWDESLLKVKDAMQVSRKMVEEVESWKADLLRQSEQILVEMLKDISKKMFGEGVKLDTQALHMNLNRIMENAHGLGALKIFINPNDARLLDPSWDEQQMLSLGETVKIIPSNNVLPGGCLIKGNIGTIDARVETQLDAILSTFDESDSQNS